MTHFSVQRLFKTFRMKVENERGAAGQIKRGGPHECIHQVNKMCDYFSLNTHGSEWLYLSSDCIDEPVLSSLTPINM